jgi:hypothetical protein
MAASTSIRRRIAAILLSVAVASVVAVSVADASDAVDVSGKYSLTLTFTRDCTQGSEGDNTTVHRGVTVPIAAKFEQDGSTLGFTSSGGTFVGVLDAELGFHFPDIDGDQWQGQFTVQPDGKVTLSGKVTATCFQGKGPYANVTGQRTSGPVTATQSPSPSEESLGLTGADQLYEQICPTGDEEDCSTYLNGAGIWRDAMGISHLANVTDPQRKALLVQLANIVAAAGGLAEVQGSSKNCSRFAALHALLPIFARLWVQGVSANDRKDVDGLQRAVDQADALLATAVAIEQNPQLKGTSTCG